MPTIQSNGCPIHVEVEGPENKPVLMLSNSLGTCTCGTRRSRR